MFSSIKPIPQFLLTDCITAHHTDDHNSIFWPCIMITRLLALLLRMASSGDNHHTSQTHTLKALGKEQKTRRSPRRDLLWGEYLHHKLHGWCRGHKARAERHRAWWHSFQLPMVTPGLYLLKLLQFEQLELSKEHSFPFLELLPSFSCCC